MILFKSDQITSKYSKEAHDCIYNCGNVYKSQNTTDGKESLCNTGDAGDMGRSLGQEDALEKGMATHSRILA